jgi:AraC-like DNA-binding protein
MRFMAELRGSDSPYVECVVRGQAEADTSLPCPADGRWNLRFAHWRGQVRVSVEGPITQAVPKTHREGVDWLVIKFRLGVHLPTFEVSHLVDSDMLLPEVVRDSFWLDGCTWQLPDFENADTFVDHLVREEIVRFDPVVSAALNDQPQSIAPRTLRHRFQHVTGLRHSTVRQIERAREAMALLEQGTPILEVVERLTYADQPHLTRSLKRFMGYTPARVGQLLETV